MRDRGGQFELSASTTWVRRAQPAPGLRHRPRTEAGRVPTAHPRVHLAVTARAQDPIELTARLAPLNLIARAGGCTTSGDDLHLKPSTTRGRAAAHPGHGTSGWHRRGRGSGAPGVQYRGRGDGQRRRAPQRRQLDSRKETVELFKAHCVTAANETGVLRRLTKYDW